MRVEQRRWLWQWIWVWSFFVVFLFALLDFIEARYFPNLNRGTLRIYHLVRGGTGAALTSLLAVWLLYRERKRFEEELIRSERLAAMGKMSSLFAHEIKNPLGSISLNVELLEEELSPLAGGEIKRLLDAIMGEGERMAHITDTYLRFARFPKSVLRPTTVEGVVNRLIEVVHGEVVRRRVKIVKEIVPDLPALLLDGEQMHQALLNIARNSFDAMEKGGTLTFQAEREGETVSLTISDTGVGMTEKQRLHIFEPFFSTKAHGTGLGLTAALQVVEEHGGKIFCESAVGKGSRFVIQLPVQRKRFTRGGDEFDAEKTEHSARRG